MDITDAEAHDLNLPQDPVVMGHRHPDAQPMPVRSLLTEAVLRLKLQQPNVAEDAAIINQSKPTNLSDNRFHRKGQSSRRATTNKRTGRREESAEEMILRLSNEFQPLVEPDWDTVVYIGPPPQEYQQDNHEYEYIKQHFANPYLMNSETLRQANSSRFNKYLGPLSARSERKLKKLGVHHTLPLDSRPQYYIDLRPMQEEEEALLMITELTCTPSILSWHLSHLASGVPKTLIGGKDNLNYTSQPYTRPWIEVDDFKVNGPEGEERNDAKTNATEAEIQSSVLNLEPEYSSIRHYTAIERLLHALAGYDPKLNSAAKVWTFFSIAKFFDVVNDARVTKWIYDWLFTSSNANFIQANPEISFRMAMGMRSPDMLRTTFATLVGERALMQANRTASDSIVMRPGLNQVSVHGRTICHLDDDDINRIDHAALSLIRRMTQAFHRIANGPLVPTLMTPELAKFEALKILYGEAIIEECSDLLQEYVRGEVFAALSRNVHEGDLMRLHRTRGFKDHPWLKRSEAAANTYNAMPLPQRLLTQSFWSQLENQGLYQEREYTATWSSDYSCFGLKDLAPDFDNGIDRVNKIDLQCTIDAMNDETLKQLNMAHLNMVDRSLVPPADASDVGTITNWSPRAIATEPYESSYATNPDREVVRAMHSLELPQVTVPGFKHTRFDDVELNQDYPYNAIAQSYRQTGGPLMIQTASLLAELTVELRKKIMNEILMPSSVYEEMGIESQISISQMEILLCLNDDEWKYLPLWADGLDDGSGGVFAELDVPDMEAIEGFRGGAIGLESFPAGEGSAGGSFSMIDDCEDYDQVMTDEAVSTVGKASRIATDGTTSAGASTIISLDE